MILGIDPGLTNIGFAVIRGDGSFKVSGVLAITTGMVDCELAVAFEDLQELLLDHWEDPWVGNVMAVEGCYVGGNARLAVRLGEIVGLVHALAIMADVEFMEIAPASARKALTGNGRAADRRALQCAWEHAGNDSLTIHEADALGVALAALEVLGKSGEGGEAE
uniref:Putative Crossover junction endodeoxyribonuclease n=1 Tax=viral metagenome TaxID=1070528 RepID=A0A6H1ZZF5_9ZZZZ